MIFPQVPAPGFHRRTKLSGEEQERLAITLAAILRAREGVLLDACGPVAEEEIAAAERELGVAFPASYRVFLQRYGGGRLRRQRIFGICRDHLRHDVVLRNQLIPAPVPGKYLRFAQDRNGVDYYFDLARSRPDHECPVIVFGPDGTGCTSAEGFLEFCREAVAGGAVSGEPGKRKSFPEARDWAVEQRA
jgi:hypothetical protein